jgi:hypothetical protein
MVRGGFSCEGLLEIYGSGFRKSTRDGVLTKKQRAQTVNHARALRFLCNDKRYFESFAAAAACSAAVQGGTTPLVLAYAMDCPRCSCR